VPGVGDTMRWKSITRPLAVLAIACAAVAALLVLTPAVIALPADLTVAVTSPAAGSVVTVWNPTITANATSTAPINSAATLVLDGVSRAVTLSFPQSGGHWEWDDWDEWWVSDYDYLHASLSWVAPTLVDGSHAATLTVTDTAGNTTSRPWTFTVQAPPKAITYQPANGAALTGNRPLISATMTDNGSIAGAQLKLDAAAFPATWNAATKVISGTPATALADGPHTVTVTATDTMGFASTTSWTFTIVNSASTVFSAASPAAGGSTNVWNPTISVACSDTALLNNATMWVDGATVNRTFTVTNGGHSGLVSFKPTTLADGAHTAKVTVTNNLGFSSTQTWSFTVAAPPVVTISAPADGGWATTLTPSIKATVADNGAIAMASVMVDGVSFPTTYDPITKIACGTPSTALADDATHTVSVAVTDAAGNVGTRSWTFRTHATLPAVTAVSPAPGSAASVSSPVLSVSFADAMGLAAQPSMVLDGVSVPCSWSYTQSGGYWEGDEWDDWWVPIYDYTRGTVSRSSSALSNGTHTATVQVTNNIGGVKSYTWSFTVGAPPQVSLPSPAQGAFVSTLTPTVSAKVTSNATIASTSVFIDGVAALSSYNGTTKVVSAIPLSPLVDDAPHTVLVTVTDTGGLSGTLTWDFVTHSAPPTLGVTLPAAGSIGVGSRPRISIDASDWSGLTGSPVMTLDGAPVSESWTYLEIGGYWEDDPYEPWWVPEYDYTRGTASFTPATLADGPHTVTATITNKAGLASTTFWTFSVGEPPKLSAPSPAAGSWVPTLTPTITANLTDNATIATTTVFIDGVAGVSAYDPIAHKVTARPLTAIAEDAPHTVLLIATDSSGLSASLTWTFNTHAAAPIVDAWAPAPTTNIWNPTVFLSAADASGLTGQPTMSIDGVPVACSWSYVQSGGYWVDDPYEPWWVPEYDYTRGTVSYHPTNIPDGTHTATVQVRNNAGTTRTFMWSFAVQSPPRLSNAKPSGSAWVTTQTPEISVAVADNSGIGSIVATLDGAAVPADYDAASGRVRVHSAAALANDLDHSVAIRVSDPSGNASSISWTFYAQIYAPMPGTGAGNCVSCHTSYPASHPMSNCDACHGPGGPVEDCRSCHGYGGHGPGVFDATDWAGPYPCARCHQPAYEGRAPMHPADDMYHNTSRDMSACRPCHVTSLSVEHYRYKDGSGADLTCQTCHLSTNSDVVAAIASGNTDCSACHDLGSESNGSHVAVHAIDGVTGTVELFSAAHETAGGHITADIDCGLCHEVGNISALHGNQCSTCHGGPRDSFATWDKGCQQGACHPVIHARADAGHQAAVLTGPPPGGCACHDHDTWDVELANCGACHQLVDHVAPSTTSDTAENYLGAATIRFTATDSPSPGGSGVAATHYVVDGGSERTGAVALVSNVGSHTLEFWSVDAAGNAETHKSVTFTVDVDSTPPTTSSDAKPSYFGTATISFSAADDGSTTPVTFFRLDGATVTTGSAVTVAPPATGTDSHTLEFWSVDAAGNVESAHHTVAFTVGLDAVPPVTTSDLKPFYRVGSTAQIILTATDSGSGVAQSYYKIDAGPTWTGAIWLLSSYAAGPHTLEYWSADKSGNVEAHHVSTFTLDGTAPTTASDAQPSMPSPAAISFTASDGPSGSGVGSTFYRVDGGAQTAGSSVTVYRAGSHTVEFWSVDNVGNIETPHKTTTFNVTATDFIAPSTSSDASATYVATATVHLTGADNPGGSGVDATYYKLDGGAQKTGNTVIVESPGAHSLEFWSVDRAGNVETPHKTAAFTVTVPGGSGTIQFAWDNPPAGAWTYYYVYDIYDSQDRLVASGYNETGWFTVNVPVSSQPYKLRAHWLDPEDPGYPVWSYGQALIDTPGKVVTWYY
jgi:hypothetical protein